MNSVSFLGKNGAHPSSFLASFFFFIAIISSASRLFCDQWSESFWLRFSAPVPFFSFRATPYFLSRDGFLNMAQLTMVLRPSILFFRPFPFRFPLLQGFVPFAPGLYRFDPVLR